MKKIYIVLGVFAVTFLFVFSMPNKEEAILQSPVDTTVQYEVLDENVESNKETKDEIISDKKEDVKEDKENGEVIKKKEETIKQTNKNGKVYKISIPTYNQKTEGYPRGCEGVSLYMCLKGKGYIKSMSIDEFMKTMPLSYDDNPEHGYVGDPTKGKNADINIGKRTTIHPEPLTKWGNQFGKCKNLEGYSVDVLIKEIKKGNPIVVWVTSSWNTPKYVTYSFGETVSNNHATCLVGYDENSNQFLINDCSSKNTGEYWIDRSLFEKTYNPRKYAVAII